MDLNGRTAFVTGGGRGIGRAISLTLARAGADVAINYRRDEDAARQTAEEVRALGRRVEVYQGDISQWEDCERMTQAALAAFGTFDILVNNAGNASRGQTVVDTDPTEPGRLLGTHAIGAFHMCKLLVPAMRARPRGDVIMISSGATEGMAANGAPYNMAKAALEALSYTLAKEERRHGIRVNTVASGLADTEMGRRLARATRGVQDIHELAAESPFGFVLTPQDVANMVAFLCTEQARYITGQRIAVHGGMFRD